MDLKNFFAMTKDISVDKFVEASVTYWLIHFGNLALLSALANLYIKCNHIRTSFSLSL